MRSLAYPFYRLHSLQDGHNRADQLVKTLHCAGRVMVSRRVGRGKRKGKRIRALVALITNSLLFSQINDKSPPSPLPASIYKQAKK